MAVNIHITDLYNIGGDRRRIPPSNGIILTNIHGYISYCRFLGGYSWLVALLGALFLVFFSIHIPWVRGMIYLAALEFQVFRSQGLIQVCRSYKNFEGCTASAYKIWLKVLETETDSWEWISFLVCAMVLCARRVASQGKADALMSARFRCLIKVWKEIERERRAGAVLSWPQIVVLSQQVNANAMMKCMTNSIERFWGYVAVGASISRRPAKQQLGAFYMPQQLPLMRIIFYDFKRKYLVLVKKYYPHNSI